MKEKRIMTLHANESVMKEEAKGILCRKHKILSFRFLLMVLLITIVTGSFFIACNSEDPFSKDNEFETYLSISKSDFDLVRDWEGLSESDKNALYLAQKRMNFTFDKNGICTTKWTSSSQVNMSDELFKYFINVIKYSNEVTKDLSKIQGIKYPRLKTGDYESNGDDCVIQSLYYILNGWGASYTISDINNYAIDNNYYGQNGGVSTGLLFQFLSGGFIPTVTYSDFVNFNSSSCEYVLILKATPIHAVVFSSYSSNTHKINYWDAQNNTSGSCNINEIQQIFMATNYY
jgi:hypothetical protein